MKKQIMLLALLGVHSAFALSEVVDGFTWQYTVANGRATIAQGGVSPAKGRIVIPSKLGGYPVTAIAYYAFGYTSYQYDGKAITEIVVPEGVETIESAAFWICSGLQKISLPSTLRSVGQHTFYQCYNLKTIEMRCPPPVSLEISDLLSESTDCDFRCRRCDAAAWRKYIAGHRLTEFLDEDNVDVEIVSAGFRKEDPTVYDVCYKVISSLDKVRVRAVAFAKGERSLSNFVKVETLIEGTDVNVGDSIAPNCEHRISWRVSSDWSIDLSKVQVEILAAPQDGLLPLELMDLPTTEAHKAMRISWNALRAEKVFDALLWLCADGDTGLTLSAGVLRNGNTVLAANTGLYESSKAVAYVLSRMGYSVLSGADLQYAKNLTRLDLQPNGVRQYAMMALE